MHCQNYELRPSHNAELELQSCTPELLKLCAPATLNIRSTFWDGHFLSAVEGIWRCRTKERLCWVAKMEQLFRKGIMRQDYEILGKSDVGGNLLVNPPREVWERTAPWLNSRRFNSRRYNPSIHHDVCNRLRKTKAASACTSGRDGGRSLVSGLFFSTKSTSDCQFTSSPTLQ